MRRTAILAVAAILGVTACSGGNDESSPDSFPERDIVLTVPFGPGGSTDPLARAIAAQMEKLSGVSVIVENIEGGGGAIGTQRMLEKEPDGYSIGLSSNSILGFQPVMQPDLSFQDVNDWEPIIRLGVQHTVMVAPADAPYNNWDEFISYVREHPGEVRAGHTGINALNEVSIRELNAAANIEIVGVPFTGGGEYIPALLGGRIEAAAGYYAGLAGAVEARQLKVIGCFCDEPHSVLPDVQTIADAGYPGVGFSAHNYLIAPPGVPDEVLKRLRELAEEAWRTEEFQEFRRQNGFSGDLIPPEEIRNEVLQYRERFETLFVRSG